MRWLAYVGGAVLAALVAFWGLLGLRRNSGTLTDTVTDALRRDRKRAEERARKAEAEAKKAGEAELVDAHKEARDAAHSGSSELDDLADSINRIGNE